MSQTTTDILLHPVRLRIVLALGSERLTTAEMAERLPDIAHATLYRQVAVLAEAGMLEVVDERRVRGSIERTYALVAEAARIGPEDAAVMSRDELLRGFVLFAGSLIGSLSRYLGDPGTRPREDALSYRQAALWIDPAERELLLERLRAAIGPFLQNEPTPSRRRLLVNTVLIPDPLAAPGGETLDGVPSRRADGPPVAERSS